MAIDDAIKELPRIKRDDLLAIKAVLDQLPKEWPNVGKAEKIKVYAMLEASLWPDSPEDDAESTNLPKEQKWRKNIENMETSKEGIIEQAQAHTPYAIDELQEIALDATELKDALRKLHELDDVSSRTEAEVAITGLHEVATRSMTAARQLGLQAVEQGLISQARLAKLLNVSQMTVSRWTRDGLDNRPHVDVRNLSPRKKD